MLFFPLGITKNPCFKEEQLGGKREGFLHSIHTPSEGHLRQLVTRQGLHSIVVVSSKNPFSQGQFNDTSVDLPGVLEH